MCGNNMSLASHSLVLLVFTPSYAVLPELSPFLSIALVTQICVSSSVHLCSFPAMSVGDRMDPAVAGAVFLSGPLWSWL